MWQRFTERARKIVFHAQEEAAAVGENYVSTEHLLLGIMRTPDNLGARMLGQLGISPEALRAAVEPFVTSGDVRLGQDMQLAPRAKRVIDLAYDEAKQLKNNFIGTEHILLGLRRENEGVAAKVLIDFGVTLAALREQLLLLQDKGSASDELPKPRPGFESVAAKINAMMGANDDKRVKETLEQEELLTLDEAVKFLGTSRPTLYRLLGQDEIKGLKVGRQWRFRKADLVAYMERGPVAFTAAPVEALDLELAFFAAQLGQDAPDLGGDAESKTVTLAGNIIQLAIKARASDIHLDPTPDDFLLRLRLDGVLQPLRRLPLAMRESLTARYKIMAEMDVNEKRLPQEGRIPVKSSGKEYDIRASVVPSVFGEALTLRILDRSTVLIGLDNLGLTPEDAAQIRGLLRKPNGIFLAAGPAESGKTTLLYSCLQEVAAGEKKTMTVEDPVEFVLPLTTQVQVSSKIGLTFAAALRWFSGQDPDVILVGEIPDLETASLVVERALNGHFVLSALPANDAVSALCRILDMGSEPYRVTATVAGVAAMRLCRRLCPDCKAPVDLAEEPALAYMIPLAAEAGYDIPADAVSFRGRGCEQCRGKGYKGRIGLYEVFPMTEALAEAILRRASAEELTVIAVAGGMKTLLADGVRKAAEGQTTLEEVLRVIPDPHR